MNGKIDSFKWITITQRKAPVHWYNWYTGLIIKFRWIRGKFLPSALYVTWIQWHFYSI